MENGSIRTTITVVTENKPGVLFRIANLFLRRKVNIESLTVSEIKSKGLSRFTIVVKKEASLVEKIIKQLKRIIEVYNVYAHSDEDLIFKEISLIRVDTRDKKSLTKIEELVAQFQATIIHTEKNSLIVQKTGSEQDIEFLCSVLEPFNVIEIVRSGRIALVKKK